MQIGAFNVTPSENEWTINCELKDHPPDPIPEDQFLLRADVERTLTVLKMLSDREKRDRDRFIEYYPPLVSIARDGLQGDNARPDVALRALANLQQQITTREAGRIKHRYMKWLAKYASWVGIPCFLVATSFLFLPEFNLGIQNNQPVIESNTIASFFLLVAGCTAGVWLSFGVRRQTLTFFELHIPEPDQLHPLMRVAFATLLTIIISLLFALEALTVGVGGDLSTNQIYCNPLLAWLIGALCGFSEQLLSKQVSEQAGRIFPFFGSTSGNGT